MTKTVLLVEDDADVRDMVRTALERSGYGVLIAGNGIEAEELLNAQAVDLVITDIFMPEKDGIETIKIALKRRPGTPIIAMSGGSPRLQLDFLAFAERLGVAATMAKPILPSRMIAKVEQLIGSS